MWIYLVTLLGTDIVGTLRLDDISRNSFLRQLQHKYLEMMNISPKVVYVGLLYDTELLKPNSNKRFCTKVKIGIRTQDQQIESQRENIKNYQ